jgi:hypothetical protein
MARGVGGSEDNRGASSSGAVYLFRRGSDGSWAQEAYVKASNTDPEDHFGSSVAISNDGSTLVVGAEYEDSAARGINGNQANNDASNSGAVYVYRDFAGGGTGVVTYDGEIQPILRNHCGSCHGVGSRYPFAETYAVLQQPSELCSGDNVGTCVALALEVLRTEGGGCRTYVDPFHREGWVCLGEGARALIERWVSDGMVER